MTVDMSDYDKAMERYEGAMDKAEEIAKGLLKDGVPMEIIVRNTGLSEKKIRELQFVYLSKFERPRWPLFLCFASKLQCLCFWGL